MVILPLYQVIFATLSENKTQIAVLMKDNRVSPINLPLQYPAYATKRQRIYGISQGKEKDLIGYSKFKLAATEITPIFTLSSSRILYPTIAPDNQKVAFIAYDKETDKTLLRVTLREEFGWFPMPFVKMPSALSPACFGNNDTVIYTGEDDSLNAVSVTQKTPVPVKLAEKGRMPAYHPERKILAYVNGLEIIISGIVSATLRVNAPITAIAFAKDGNALYYAESNHLKKYDFKTESTEEIYLSDAAIIFVAEP